MSVAHTDVGAYALGLLEEDDRRAFEDHLGECASCAAEVEDFAGMRDLFTGVEPFEPAPGFAEPKDAPRDVIDLLHRRRRAALRRRRWTSVIGLVAGIALVAGGAAIGAAIAGDAEAPDHGSPAAELLARGERHSATDPATRAKGVVALESRPWGTQVALDLGNVRGPLTCRLVAVTRAEGRQPVTEWAVPAKGYGVPGSRDHLQIHGGSSARRSDIVGFEVLIEGGGRLLTIPV
ncbi:zf-HC2 domain-containing protein [Actinomadura sp. HBU206391]|uniref:zf-HC2 domain-containing protein n=1 Tax=Actinomadura sp. HBU206391 TaxID=2731692 RepID=UPI00165047C9|nr:zf-HC2 domain-containing protein [Actinomadura sp. HBU206391]MBC6460486.1 zf-HC2 domain-containing protein [Actinomadura sp. HBU206391]